MQRRLSEIWTEELAERVGFIGKLGPNDPLITSLEYDSRSVQQGSLFFALPGLHADGHDFIEHAVERGASIVVYQSTPPFRDPNVLYIRVADSRFAMSAISASFYDNPSKKLFVVGVTGTEGKSTVVYLIYQLLRLAKKRAGFISTVQYAVDGKEHNNPEHQTTPEAPVIHKYLSAMVEWRADFAVIEASSHGLSPLTNRLGDIDFDVAVMTNVRHEHLEFHGTWEQYRDDKANLFRAINHSKRLPSFAVVNADDPSADYFAKATEKRTFSFSLKPGSANLCLQSIESRADGNDCILKERYWHELYSVCDKLPGAFNAGNVMASLIVASFLTKKAVVDLLRFVPQLRPVRGRMTAVDKGQPFEVVVDYAHTPSSFEAVLPPLRKRIDDKGTRIISLFGSAGERDTKKRKLMGAVAARWSDLIVLTDEDPRGEDPMAILEEIALGVQGGKRGEDLFLIPDRPQAIRKAFALARPGDLVLLLGKGHENSIIYSRGDKKTIPYDEISEAEKALEELKGNG
ncbi:MAG: UDP-N-acetylmuramoyl-L-alanyl-D-glutamate--2,6-diaminopimelate ligase [Spirochaetaceae bacterium]|jgi:UDP-N-acetylmuramoyl-L-alanyl-D-glutamate--2,6-diaminopimelate ligase|nr:UDP-N-acetylmuramoyl-L-alanyl-D-glutamate--2,6-diaminopimelate ligase [Spirochaetaceae bacterium]